MALPRRPLGHRALRGPAPEPRQRHRPPELRDVELVHQPGDRPDRAVRPARRLREGGPRAAEAPRREGRSPAPRCPRRRADRAHPRSGRLHRRPGRGSVQERSLPLLARSDEGDDPGGRAGHAAAAAHLPDAEADGAGAERAGHGAHRRLLQRAGFAGDHQCLLPPRADPGAFRRRLRVRDPLTYSDEAEPLGTAGGVGKARDFLAEADSFLVISGDALTDIDLGAMREAHEASDGDRHPGDQAGRRHPPVRRGHHRRRRPHPGVSGEAGTGRGALGPRQLRHLHVPARDLRPLPPRGAPKSGRRRRPARGFRGLGDGRIPGSVGDDVPFHSHEVDAYWNDIGSVSEYVQGNFDALTGSSRSRAKSGRRRDLRRRGRRPRRGQGEAAGPDRVELRGGGGRRLHGPVVVGDGCRIGAGAMVRDAVVLPGHRARRGKAIGGGRRSTASCATGRWVEGIRPSTTAASRRDPPVFSWREGGACRVCGCRSAVRGHHGSEGHLVSTIRTTRSSSSTRSRSRSSRSAGASPRRSPQRAPPTCSAWVRC